MKSLSFGRKHEKGQGLVEYALILVLVAIVVIAALTVLGPVIGNVFSSVSTSITEAGSGSGDGTLVEAAPEGSVPCPQWWADSCNPTTHVASCTATVYKCSPK